MSASPSSPSSHSAILSPSPHPQEAEEENSKPARAHTSIPLPDVISIKVHFRKGQPRVRCRVSKDLPLPTFRHRKTEDSYGVLTARIKTALAGVNGLEWPSGGHPYIQPTHTTTQQNYQELNEDNFNEFIAKAWRSEARRLENPADIFINVYVYLSVPAKRATTGNRNNIQRASRSRIEAAHTIIASAVERRTLPELGPITVAHYARHLARQPSLPAEREVLTLPETNTFRQTQHLDEQVHSHNLKRQAAEDEQQEEFRTIKLKVNGTVVCYEIELRSLRAALNLPNFDLNGLANFAQDQIALPEDDMDDIDHAED
ncbi:hypothetical protein BC939DRAFT_453335 [Gamsiella multidivaricata]|uniref:uncharacterized protein n=1 Tax=Gamsiella multidivaricata TaxID=101098 RepID=UPI00221FC820|nr:uncharacterized protein BC939DRAFT_453335 [Gamsiella multidivaricata]KAG0353091.1 hypothetical protein BGZ54_002415 [Gamsiella multidivaricata]KAI7822691.1 hypothetical protein BC939DRAFT_453335 [Gamsiella multidivaricata]